MFGEGIYNSTLGYLALINQATTLENNLTFSSAENYSALLRQAIWLALAGVYLLLRRFDFSVFTKRIKLTPWLPLQIIGIFVAAALAMDLFYIIGYSVFAPAVPSMTMPFAEVDLSLFLYSLLNGFYEEIFFLGICLAVKPEHIKWSLPYSLLVRCSFHTYQGLGTAIFMGIMLGLLFFFLYRKLKPQNLLPFFLAHAVADMIGLSLIFSFWN